MKHPNSPNKRLTRLSILLAVAAPALVGQYIELAGDDSIPAAAEVLNIDKLSVSIALDRLVYAPGEIATITVSVTNPGTEAVLALDPFWPRGAGFDLLNEDGNSEFQFVSPHPYTQSRVYRPHPEDRSITVAPGQKLTKTVRSDEMVFASNLALLRGAMPRIPGRYRLCYSYEPTACADFQVAEVSWTNTVQFSIDGPPGNALPSATVLAAVGKIGSQTVVFRTARALNLRPNISPATPSGLEMLNRLIFLTRLDESAQPITDLAVQNDPTRGSTIKWTSNGVNKVAGPFELRSDLILDTTAQNSPVQLLSPQAPPTSHAGPAVPVNPQFSIAPGGFCRHHPAQTKTVLQSTTCSSPPHRPTAPHATLPPDPARSRRDLRS